MAKLYAFFVRSRRSLRSLGSLRPPTWWTRRRLRQVGFAEPYRSGQGPPTSDRQVTLIANRIGYLFYAVAIVAFILAFAFGFKSTMSALVIASLVIGSVLLAPAIVLGYAVKAAERDDRERGL